VKIRAGGEAQVVECLPSKPEALKSDLSAAKKIIQQKCENNMNSNDNSVSKSVGCSYRNSWREIDNIE
jgi:hypothetical protein